MWLGALHLRGNHVSILPGHLVIEDDGIHRMREERSQSFFPTGRFEDGIAVALKQHLAADEPTQVVVDAENCRFKARVHGLYISSSARVRLWQTAVRSMEGAKLRSEVVGKLIGLLRECSFKLRTSTRGASYPRARDEAHVLVALMWTLEAAKG
jgi:hypothetical protein